jgi:hypothetical protein
LKDSSLRVFLPGILVEGFVMGMTARGFVAGIFVVDFVTGAVTGILEVFDGATFEVGFEGFEGFDVRILADDIVCRGVLDRGCLGGI